METVDYIRVELISIFASNLTKFLMIVFVMLQWNSALYFILFLQMVSSASLDYGFALGNIQTSTDYYIWFRLPKDVSCKPYRV